MNTEKSHIFICGRLKKARLRSKGRMHICGNRPNVLATYKQPPFMYDEHWKKTCFMTLLWKIKNGKKRYDAHVQILCNRSPQAGCLDIWVSISLFWGLHWNTHTTYQNTDLQNSLAHQTIFKTSHVTQTQQTLLDIVLGFSYSIYSHNHLFHFYNTKKHFMQFLLPYHGASNP